MKKLMWNKVWFNNELWYFRLETSDKKELGEQLFFLVREVIPARAPKITGMLLQLDNQNIINIIKDKDLLMSKIDEAVAVLEEYSRKCTTVPANGNSNIN